MKSKFVSSSEQWCGGSETAGCLFVFFFVWSVCDAVGTTYNDPRSLHRQYSWGLGAP